MRVSAGCKLPPTARLLPGALLLALLAGCPAPPRAPPAGGVAPAPPAPHVGATYDLVGSDSLLVILVYRGGALASAGHNHVIASHELSGTVYVPTDPLRTSFELHIPVATLTVDEPALRARQNPSEFPPEVPDSAREGTRRNMLGEALLDAAHSPEILLSSVGLAAGGPAAGDNTTEAGGVLAHVQSIVRGQVHTFDVPVRYQRSAQQLTATGEFALRQTQLGLAPFSALLGALQVQDEMHVSFRLVARASAIKSESSRTP
jgi:hypothetical protein